MATGQDFIANTNVSSIDYAEIHIWPDNWNVSENIVESWMSDHESDAAALGKPLVIEEFGKNVTSHTANVLAHERNPTFAAVFDALNSSLASDGSIRAAQYWMWDPSLEGPASPDWANFTQDQVPLNESTFQDIIAPTAAAAAEEANPVSGCRPQSRAPMGEVAAGAAPEPEARSVGRAAPSRGEAAAAGRRLLLRT